MAGFKSITTKRVNLLQGTPGMPLWQRNYYEHILRDNDDLDNVRRYILDNPLQWALDAENTGQSNKNDNDSGRNSTYDIATPYFPEKMKGR